MVQTRIMHGFHTSPAACGFSPRYPQIVEKPSLDTNMLGSQNSLDFVAARRGKLRGASRSRWQRACRGRLVALGRPTLDRVTPVGNRPPARTLPNSIGNNVKEPSIVPANLAPLRGSSVPPLRCFDCRSPCRPRNRTAVAIVVQVRNACQARFRTTSELRG